MEVKRSAVAFFTLSFVLLGFQNCGQIRFSIEQLTVTKNTPVNTQFNGDGQVFDGKLLVFHHTEEGFTCEGKAAPKAILNRLQTGGWVLTTNTTLKCEATFEVPVTGVEFDPVAVKATYQGDDFFPPAPYVVNGTAAPNSPDANLNDGICKNAVGLCSLQAAIDQGIFTASTATTTILLPATSITLSNDIQVVPPGPAEFPLVIRGQTGSVLNGGGVTAHLRLRILHKFKLQIQNIEFRNGFDSSVFQAASIFYDPRLTSEGDSGISPLSEVEIKNCVFANNTNGPTIYAGPGSGGLKVLGSRFQSGSYHGLQTKRLHRLLVEDSHFENVIRGVTVDSNVEYATIRRSSFVNTYEGFNFQDCTQCRVENVTVTGSQDTGFTIVTTGYSPSYDVMIINSTIYDNGFINNRPQFFNYITDTRTKIHFHSSLLGGGPPAMPVCQNNNPSYSNPMHAEGSFFRDSSCDSSVPSGHIVADMQLRSPITTSNGTYILPPHAGSSVKSLYAIPTPKRIYPVSSWHKT